MTVEKMFYTVAEAVQYGAFKTEQTAYQLKKKGEGPEYMLRGKLILYAKTDLDKWLESQRVERGSK